MSSIDGEFINAPLTSRVSTSSGYSSFRLPTRILFPVMSKLPNDELNHTKSSLMVLDAPLIAPALGNLPPRMRTDAKQTSFTFLHTSNTLSAPSSSECRQAREDETRNVIAQQALPPLAVSHIQILLGEIDRPH